MMLPGEKANAELLAWRRLLLSPIPIHLAVVQYVLHKALKIFQKAQDREYALKSEYPVLHRYVNNPDITDWDPDHLQKYEVIPLVKSPRKHPKKCQLFAVLAS